LLGYAKGDKQNPSSQAFISSRTNGHSQKVIHPRNSLRICRGIERVVSRGNPAGREARRMQAEGARAAPHEVQRVRERRAFKHGPKVPMGPFPGEEPDHHWATGWEQPTNGQQGRERPALPHAISSALSRGNVSAAKEGRRRAKGGAAALADGGGSLTTHSSSSGRTHTDRGRRVVRRNTGAIRSSGNP
jgi:hypothetical protein